MKKMFFLLVMSISLAVSAQQPTDTIQFDACHGTMDCPGIWGIIPSDVVTCINGSLHWVVNIDKIQERTDFNTQFGVIWSGSYSWVFPTNYSGGSSPTSQFVKCSEPGHYGVHNGGNELHIYVNFLSDPFITVDGSTVPGKPHLSDFENEGVIIISANSSVGININPIFAPPNGGNQLLKNGGPNGSDQTSYQITSSGDYTLKTFAEGNPTNLHYIYFQVIITPPPTHTITATTGDNGSITPSGQVQVNHGENKTFTFTPADNSYRVDQLTVDGENVPNPGTSYTFTNVTSNHNIHVTFIKKTYTITATSGPNGSISPPGTTTVDHGTSPTYTFTPADDSYKIDVVTVNGSPVTPTGNTYTFPPVTQNYTIHVTFAKKTYTITATSGPNGSISPSGSVPVNHGENKTFTFTPADASYEIHQVTVDGNPVTVTGNTHTIMNVTKNYTINVTFKKKTYTITATAGPNGSINPNGVVPVNHGENQTFNFNPEYGYEVEQVNVDDTPVPFSNNQYTITNVTKNYTIHVTFKIATVEQHTITATSGPNGSINPNGQVTVNHGATQTFTFTPLSGYEVEELKVNGTTVPDPGTSYTFTNVTQDHTIHVIFQALPPEPYTIIATAGPNGNINPNGQVTVDHGDDQTFTFTPDQNYKVDSVFIDGEYVNIGDDQHYTFTTVTSNHTIHVTFKYTNSVDEFDAFSPQVWYASGALHFRNIPPSTSLQVVDGLGRIVYQGLLTSEWIPFTGNGFYIVRLFEGRTIIQTKKIVVYPSR